MFKTAFLNSNAALAAKDFVCRQLSVIGSEVSSDVLGKLVVDKDTSDMARFAAERIQGAAIDSMLVEALKKSSGNIRHTARRTEFFGGISFKCVQIHKTANS